MRVTRPPRGRMTRRRRTRRPSPRCGRRSRRSTACRAIGTARYEPDRYSMKAAPCWQEPLGCHSHGLDDRRGCDVWGCCCGWFGGRGAGTIGPADVAGAVKAGRGGRGPAYFRAHFRRRGRDTNGTTPGERYSGGAAAQPDADGGTACLAHIARTGAPRGAAAPPHSVTRYKFAETCTSRDQRDTEFVPAKLVTTGTRNALQLLGSAGRKGRIE